MAGHSQISLPPISELFKDPFERSTPNEAATEKAQGSMCAVSFCDARYNAKGDRIYLHAGMKTSFNTPKIPGIEASALVVTKFFDKGGDIQYTETEINSPHIRQALRKVVDPDYPSLNMNADSFTARNFTQCLFFHHEQLREYGRSLEDDEAARHVDLALEHLYANHSRSMKIFKEDVEKNIESDQFEPALSFEDLWMAFRPGDLAIHTVREVDAIYRVVKTEYKTLYFPHQTYIRATLRQLECDGTAFGFRDKSYIVTTKSNSTGYTRLRDLDIRPLRYLQGSEREPLLHAARIRGKKYIQLAAGVHHCEYHGLAELTDDTISEGLEEYDSSSAMEGFAIRRRRLATDCKTGQRARDDR